MYLYVDKQRRAGGEGASTSVTKASKIYRGRNDTFSNRTFAYNKKGAQRQNESIEIKWERRHKK